MMKKDYPSRFSRVCDTFDVASCLSLQRKLWTMETIPKSKSSSPHLKYPLCAICGSFFTVSAYLCQPGKFAFYFWGGDCNLPGNPEATLSRVSFSNLKFKHIHTV